MHPTSMRPDYRFQDLINAESQKLHIPDTVTVIGTGGFGAWVGLFAALSGVKRLILFDPDKVDGVDLARCPYRTNQVGSPKAEALSVLIREVRPEAKLSTFVKEFSVAEDADKIRGIVFNGVSNKDVDLELRELGSRRRFRYFSGVYSGLDVGVMSFVPDSLQIGKETPVWVGTAALSACLAVYSAFVQPINFVGSPSELGQPREKLDERLSALSDAAR